MRLTGDTHTDLDRAFRRGWVIGLIAGAAPWFIANVVMLVVQS